MTDLPAPLTEDSSVTVLAGIISSTIHLIGLVVACANEVEFAQSILDVVPSYSGKWGPASGVGTRQPPAQHRHYGRYIPTVNTGK